MFIRSTTVLLLAILAVPALADEATPAPAPNLPYVYTNWKQFTVADGLPDDHVFAVKVDGPRVWVGTENGLALIDRPTGKVVRTWQEKDGLPFRVVTAIDVDRKTGDVWLGLFGGGLARLSGGRFDHWHQLNSGLVNDVVYGVAVENDNVWAATTAGASRLDTTTGEWTVFTEKNAPMEEIWNYSAAYDGKDKVYLGVWGSGVLEYNIRTGRWKEYLDPDGEMEIDLYRDDGINHVIVTGASPVDGVVWVSTYFGGSRYDGRHWRGYAQQEGGLPSDFNNNIRGRSAQEALYCSDKGLGIVTDAPNEEATWVVYTRDPETGRGRAKVTVGGRVVENVDMPVGVPHSFTIAADVDGDDLWVGTSKGLGWGIGQGYYAGTKPRALYAYGQPVPEPKGERATADPVKARPSTSPAPPDFIPFDDPQVVEVMKRIDAAGGYATPQMNLRKDENYAGTSEDREPFARTTPFKEHFLLQMEYAGAGRDTPEPEHLDTVKVGFIGPIQQTVSIATGGRSHEEALGVPMLRGTRLALEEWNARGGYLKRKIPFELVVSNDNGLWGSSGNEIIKQAYKDGVWGILGTIDGANSHIAIRVGLKAEVLVVNTGDTDPTFIETNIPWVARVIGDDRQQAYLLTDYWYRTLNLKRVAIVRASNRYGRFGVREIRDSARRLQRPVPIEMAYKVGQTDFRLEVERIRNANPDAVVHWGNATEGALILNTMREMGMTQPFFGCDRTVSEEFVKIAGKNAEGVVAAFPWNPERNDPRLARFRAAYRERFGTEPDAYAAHAYDGMNLMLWAINVAGLNRAKIRDLVAYLPHPWPGITGDIVLSACLDDVGDTYLATYERGAWRYASRTELRVPKGYIAPRDRLNRDQSAGAPPSDAASPSRR